MPKTYTKKQIILKLQKEVNKLEKIMSNLTKIHNNSIESVTIFELSNLRVYTRDIEKKIISFQKLLNNNLKH